MSVIGYDCEGKALQSGDTVVLLESDPNDNDLKKGDILQVRDRYISGYVTLDYESDTWAVVAVSSDIIKKLPDDQHKSGDQSFTELLSGIKRGSEVTA